MGAGVGGGSSPGILLHREPTGSVYTQTDTSCPLKEAREEESGCSRSASVGCGRRSLPRPPTPPPALCRGPAEGSEGLGAAHAAPVPLTAAAQLWPRVGRNQGIPTNCLVLPRFESPRGRAGPADPGTFPSAGVTGRDPAHSRLCTTVFLGTRQPQPPRAPGQAAAESRATTPGVYPARLQSH